MYSENQFLIYFSQSWEWDDMLHITIHVHELHKVLANFIRQEKERTDKHETESLMTGFGFVLLYCANYMIVYPENLTEYIFKKLLELIRELRKFVIL